MRNNRIKKQKETKKRLILKSFLKTSTKINNIGLVFGLMVLIILNGFDAMTQNPYMTNPTPSSMIPNGQIGTMESHYPKKPEVNYMPNASSMQERIHQQNMQLIEGTHPIYNNTQATGIAIHNEIQEMADYYYKMDLINRVRSNYWDAYNNLKDMLEGKTQMNLKKAVFEVEHAYGNNFTYEQYDSAVQRYVEIVKLKMGQDKTEPTNTAINLAISQILSDTITLKQKHKETEFISYPVAYDFDDMFGENDWTNMFVSKLLFTGKGNCHSIPLLYLIIAEELNTKAYLSLSPNHSFIKFEHNNTLYNFETTQGALVTDQWVMGSGYITSASIKNKVFMDTLNTKQTIAQCLNDLAMGYMDGFGYSDTTFINACTDLSLEHYNKGNVISHIIKCNTYLANVGMLGRQLGILSLEEAIQHPVIKEFWEKHDKAYQYIGSTGYKSIPREEYKRWLVLLY